MIILDLVVSYYSPARSSTLSIFELLVVLGNFIFVLIINFTKYFLPHGLIVFHVSEILGDFLLLGTLLRFVHCLSCLRVDLRKKLI